jgi:hypothetical protein
MFGQIRFSPRVEIASDRVRSTQESAMTPAIFAISAVNRPQDGHRGGPKN